MTLCGKPVYSWSAQCFLYMLSDSKANVLSEKTRETVKELPTTTQRTAYKTSR